MISLLTLLLALLAAGPVWADAFSSTAPPQPPNAVAITGGTISGTDVSGANVTATGSTTPRATAGRASDRVNVKDYGAAMNGTTDDTSAFNAARAAAGNSGIVFVPSGGLDIVSNPTAGSASPILWQFSGNSYGTGTTPVTGLGSDVLESTLMGTKWFTRSAAAADAPPVVRIDNTMSTAGGSAGVTPTLKINTTIAAVNTNNFVWGISSLLNSSSTGPGQHVAVAGYANRLANGTEIWGSNFSSADQTGNASSTSGALVGQELNVSANGLDDGGAGGTNGGGQTIPSGQGIRVGQDVATFKYGTGAAAEIGWGSRVSSGAGVTYKRGYSMVGTFSIAGFSTEYAVESTGSAFKLAAGQHLSFDGTDTHRMVLSGTTLQYNTGSTTLMSVDNAGNAVTAGALNVGAGASSNSLGITYISGTNSFAVKPASPGNLVLGGNGSGIVNITSAMAVPKLTVATLPTCNAGADGNLYRVSDASSPTWNATLTGGGSTETLALCNGSAWTAH